jgi:hypothetical protein
MGSGILANREPVALERIARDLGQHLTPSAVRLTEFAPAAEPLSVVSHELPKAPPAVPTGESVQEPPKAPPAVPANEPVEFGPAQWARRSFTKGFAGADFVPQPDGTLRCPAGHPLSLHERRPERYGSVRVVYGARIAHCRPCPLRAQCQETTTPRKPRQVSAVLWPIPSVAAQPLSSMDSSAAHTNRRCDLSSSSIRREPACQL